MIVPHILDIDRHFKDSLANLNHPLDESIIFDTPNWQRMDCPTSPPNNKSASYRAHSDLNPVPVLKFECHKCGIKENISYKGCETSIITPQEQAEIQLQAIKRKREQEVQSETSLNAMRAKWDGAKPCMAHPYFYRKRLMITPADGLRLDSSGNILCPVRLITGEVITIQSIPAQGKKRFYAGLPSKAGFHVFGSIEADKDIYFAEGIATAKIIHESIKKPVICVYGKRFNSIGPIVAKAYPNSRLIYCCDPPSDGEVIASEDNALKAIDLVDGSLCLPDFSNIPETLQPGIKRSDYNDLFVLLMEQGKSRADALTILKNQLAVKPKLHNQILFELINKITPVSFRELTGIADEKKLKNSHFQIITIEKILEIAKLNRWGICRNHDFVYIYNGEYWGLVDADELKSFLGEAAEAMGVDKFFARYFNFRDQLYKQFLALANLPKPTPRNDAVLINLKNGTFEITPNGVKLNPFNRANFMTYQLSFEYNPYAKAPLFEAYLDKVLPDKNLQHILAEYLGYVFIHPSILKLEKTLLLYGTGANGKSVFYEIVRSLLGDQNTSEYSLQNLTNENGYSRAMIANKLVNYASEINGKLEASIFKQLVSGEPVEARLPYGRPFIITNYAKLIFNCNELPKDVEHTEGYFRRFQIIPFEVMIPEEEQDKQLAQKIISSELSGVFNWVLLGLNRLLKQKRLTESNKVKQARDQYEKESDTTRLFLDDKEYQISPTGYIPLNKIYPEYRAFCLDNGFYPVNSINFKKRLVARGVFLDRTNIGVVVYLTLAGYKNLW
jgi:putative DNA primase/helicase